jgi:uncharacterized protein YndB with AHSA1/START domain
MPNERLKLTWQKPAPGSRTHTGTGTYLGVAVTVTLTANPGGAWREVVSLDGEEAFRQWAFGTLGALKCGAERDAKALVERRAREQEESLR